ncbi:type 1 glutamine amidotransferase domain-containing protein [Bdellovibrio sp. NC01]|uniref:type 1 glutamine amidotransferase domain-containing protein n=1 Tax=Bdellovibrio sp. NC01 TaxID=2220073 RepID=UPI001156D01B|nr:type 1 glutamine amidotransferase domain-containing protein [Bdellovibrio sp. NC01]QDK38749.1 hypothetical protein DOE51_14715 [Bdellovibrio sp. NC01]
MNTRIKKILMPLPSRDFDPTETAIPWQTLTRSTTQVYFATPDGKVSQCDQRMLYGYGLGFLSSFLIADKNAQSAYRAMEASPEFQSPMKWSDIRSEDFDGLLLPGGHAPGMKEYLESEFLQNVVCSFFEMQKPVGAICHGVVLAARSRNKNGQSVLSGKKTTSLLAVQELLAWGLTCLWLGNYYRTYSQTVEAEVRQSLKSSADFVKGPAPLLRDSLAHMDRGFALTDGNYISARWPGDAHVFSNAFLARLKQ